MCYIFYCNTYPLLACDILKFNMFDMLAAASAMAGVVYVTTEHNRLYTCNLTTPSALNVFFFFFECADGFAPFLRNAAR